MGMTDWIILSKLVLYRQNAERPIVSRVATTDCST